MKKFKTVKAWAVFGTNSDLPMLFECKSEAENYQKVINKACGVCDHDYKPVLIEIRIPLNSKRRGK